MPAAMIARRPHDRDASRERRTGASAHGPTPGPEVGHPPWYQLVPERFSVLMPKASLRSDSPSHGTRDRESVNGEHELPGAQNVLTNRSDDRQRCGASHGPRERPWSGPEDRSDAVVAAAGRGGRDHPAVHQRARDPWVW